MGDEPFAQDAEPRERRQVLGWVFLFILLVLACVAVAAFGGYRLINSGGPSATDTPTYTSVPVTTEPTETDTPTPTAPLTEATEPPTEVTSTEEVTCSETGRYCTCAGVGYSVVMCPDGSRTDKPIGKCTPDPAQCGTNTNDNTSCAPCCDHGGVQFTGPFCTCQGQVDIVTICQDGSKSDNITTDSCTPDPAQCNPSDNTNNNKVPGCMTTAPGCDGVDNDCDGAVDELDPADCWLILN